MHTLTILVNESHCDKPMLLEQFAATDFSELVRKYNVWLETEWAPRVEREVKPFVTYDKNGDWGDHAGEALVSHLESQHDEFAAYYNYVEV